MSRRDPRRARLLGVWTAGWLAVFLLAGVLRLGDLSVQWPVLAVPLLWLLVALRPRRRPAWEQHRLDGAEHDEGWADEDWDDGSWDDGGWDDGALPPPGAENRTDTVERPAVRPPGPDDRPGWPRRD
ncbi:hypothetical protein [Blastococcus sp. CCUG 61487]|uniref:hypothetical protein n=1 Tax=Blastococcus sp. CCUG 61487 TaxID=1840703 RepID=UPI0010C0B67B|nr:hypothetical protein [Blastococcus sp. CCUG 61487]TKJ18815.1 hypothetical protein A6V29_11130 [Blastococcus sp. CCUG 61487]